jgi:hypothetical protein
MAEHNRMERLSIRHGADQVGGILAEPESQPDSGLHFFVLSKFEEKARRSQMSNRGGRRPGAGRPVGSKNQRTAEIARAAAESGITPIEVMLGAMRELWDVGTPEAKREAAEIAKDAAPYIHPRLASIDQTVSETRPFALLVEPCSNAEEWEARYGPQATLEDKSSGKV